MPRVARTIFAHIPHHITQRGNRRGDVFFTADDYISYLSWLKEYIDKHQVEVLAYCLMTNHVYIVAVPSTDEVNIKGSDLDIWYKSIKTKTLFYL